MPSLVTHSASQSTGAFNDPSISTARSVLFRNGTVYTGNRQFWRQDSGGNTFGLY